MTFQQSIDRLEEIVVVMEQNTVSIEESLALYKEGMQLSVQCGLYLNAIEQEVKQLQEEAGGVFGLAPFFKEESL